MSTLHGLAIGVERYRSPKFKSVRYAEKDASDFRDAFIALGCAEENFALLKSEDVTFATMNTRLKRVTRDAGKDDSLVIFFAGHGLYTAGRSYLICSDSDIHEIPTTAISLEEIFDYLRASQCTQCSLFIDACHSGVELDNNVRDTIDHLSVEELEAFFEEADYRVAFASCRADEKSYTSLQAQNGIWSHFLIKALRGEADEAVKDGHLTSASLQDYLAKNVPRRAKAENGAGASQHPQIFGRFSNTFRVADLRPLIAAREADKKTETLATQDIRLLGGANGGSVKSLKGWRSGHQVPKNTEDYSLSFLAQIAKDDLQTELDQLFQGFMEAFDYEFDSMECGREGRAGSIVTPDFTLDVEYTLREDYPSDYEVKYELHGIASSSIFDNEDFNSLLEAKFDVVTLTLEPPLIMRDWIRKLQKDKSLRVRVPSSGDKCTVSGPNISGSVAMSAREIRFELTGRQSPGETLQSFKAVVTALQVHGGGVAGLLGG